MNKTTTPDTATIESLQLENAELKAKVAWYEEQFRLYQHKKFGASSERFEHQEELFNEAEALIEENAEEVAEEPIDTQTIEAHERKKPVRRKPAIPADHVSVAK